jgi:hypothetical protein
MRDMHLWMRFVMSEATITPSLFVCNSSMSVLRIYMNNDEVLFITLSYIAFKSSGD